MLHTTIRQFFVVAITTLLALQAPASIAANDKDKAQNKYGNSTEVLQENCGNDQNCRNRSQQKDMNKQKNQQKDMNKQKNQQKDKQKSKQKKSN